MRFDRRNIIFIIIWAVSVAAVSMVAARADHTYGTASRWPELPATIAVTDDNAVAVDDALAPWNRLAQATVGTDAFTRTGDPETADVVIRRADGDQTWIRVNDGTYNGGRLLGVLRSCVVNMAPDSWDDRRIVIHELGHCLGFADHQNGDQYRLAAVNPALCDRPQHPAHRDYTGVMSYCSFQRSQWFGADDRTMFHDRYGSGPQPPEPVETAVIVNADASADALVAAPMGHPILLVERDRIPGATAAELHHYSSVIVVGGHRRVSRDVRRRLRDDFDLEVDTRAGFDRFSTARIVSYNLRNR